jgi:hypothetical protein
MQSIDITSFFLLDRINSFIISGNTRARILFFSFVAITKYLLLSLCDLQFVDYPIPWIFTIIYRFLLQSIDL